mmetsp:Transcript_13989/g.29484  ORF Transcript_13989/g.29484 Transcript_13989/m.29484 type:complete len:277 (-) Transcript_13989:107-937(-)
MKTLPRFLDRIRPVQGNIIKEGFDTRPGIPPTQRLQPIAAFGLEHHIQKIGRFRIQPHLQVDRIDARAAIDALPTRRLEVHPQLRSGVATFSELIFRQGLGEAPPLGSGRRRIITGNGRDTKGLAPLDAEVGPHFTALRHAAFAATVSRRPRRGDGGGNGVRVVGRIGSFSAEALHEQARKAAHSALGATLGLGSRCVPHGVAIAVEDPDVVVVTFVGIATGAEVGDGWCGEFVVADVPSHDCGCRCRRCGLVSWIDDGFVGMLVMARASAREHLV